MSDRGGRAPRIVALGGHEFSSKAHDRAICRFLLALTGAERPRACLLPTASGDPREGIASFHRTMERFECEPSHVSLFRLERERVDLREHLLAQDLVYVAGGSLVNLLAIWRAHGLAELMADVWRRGVVLAGQSAGAMCWFQSGITASTGAPTLSPGLGLLDGSLCVHYARDPHRRDAYLDAVASGAAPDGIALDDGAGLLFEDRKPVEAFAGARGARVFRVERQGDTARETELRPLPLRWEDEPAVDPAIAEMRELRRAAYDRGHGAAARTSRPTAARTLPQGSAGG